MQGRRVLYVLLEKNVLEILPIDIDPMGGNNPPLIHGVLVGMGDRNGFVFGREARKRKRADKRQSFLCRLRGPEQVGENIRQLLATWNLVETAHTYRNRMSGTATQNLQQSVTYLLQEESSPTLLGVVSRHGDRTCGHAVRSRDQRAWLSVVTSRGPVDCLSGGKRPLRERQDPKG
jgi:hypothetical protein